MPLADIEHYYVDPSITPTGSGFGETPADACPDPTWTAESSHQIWNSQVIIWVRRGVYISPISELEQFGDWGNPPYIVKWPAVGEDYYDIRPQAGIDAGWDDDPDIDPTFMCDGQFGFGMTIKTAHCYGLRFFAGQGTWSGHPRLGGTYTPGAPHYGTQIEGIYDFAAIYINDYRTNTFFANCTFEPDDNTYFGCLIAADEGADLFFFGCKFKQHTTVPQTLPHDQFNSVICHYFLPANGADWAWASTSYSAAFVNCDFDGVLQNDQTQPNVTVRSGLVVNQTMANVTFEGCKFTNTGGRFVGAMGGYPAMGDRQQSPGGALCTIELTGCELDGYAPSFDFQTNFRGLYWSGTPRYSTFPNNFGMHQPFLDLDIPMAVSAYRCKNHPLSQRYCFDVSTYTMYETDQYPRVGGNEFQYAFITHPKMDTHFTNHPRKVDVVPELTAWPTLQYMSSWSIPPNVGVPQTLTVYVKTLEWSILPTADQLFLHVIYIGGTGYTKVSKAMSTQSVSTNDTWTALSVTITPLENVPINLRLSVRCYEAGSPTRLIVLDPAVEVT